SAVFTSFRHHCDVKRCHLLPVFHVLWPSRIDGFSWSLLASMLPVTATGSADPCKFRHLIDDLRQLVEGGMERICHGSFALHRFVRRAIHFPTFFFRPFLPTMSGLKPEPRSFGTLPVMEEKVLGFVHHSLWRALAEDPAGQIAFQNKGSGVFVRQTLAR
ncbi:hypothetical protein IscW_ISCW010246, partial [Ixodes scapularis]